MAPDRVESCQALVDLYESPTFLLHRTHRLARSIFRSQCLALGLSEPQYSVLTAVQAEPGCSQSTVARLLLINKVTALKIVRGLQAAGLLLCNRSGRAVALELTERGDEVLRSVQDLSCRASDALTRALSPVQRGELMALLDKLVSGHQHCGR